LLHRACPRVAPNSPLFTEAERVALEHADATTETVNNLHDAVFARLREHYDDGQIEELTMLIARENASSLQPGVPRTFRGALEARLTRKPRTTLFLSTAPQAHMRCRACIRDWTRAMTRSG
jgi:hypothetical protein